MQYGLQNLSYAGTSINEHSSRSHSIFSVKLVSGFDSKNCKVSVLNFADLAGSERQKKTNNVGSRLVESTKINSSLMVLGRCIKCVRNRQQNKDCTKAPFRESKLTYLLQKALQGKEDISMITYQWDNTRILLASFFWGYVIPQIGAAYLAKKHGAKYLMFGATFLNTIAFVLIPTCAEYAGSIGVLCMRVIQGFCQGALFPCAHTIMGKWAPAEERSLLGIIVYSGISCGSILSFIVTGFICSSWYGWPYSFYFFGLCGGIWCAFYLKFGHNSPAVHPSIKPEERQYIEKSLGQASGRADPAIPWKSILTCVPFWAIVAANTGSAWGYIMMMTQIPTYLGKALKFKMATNGVVSAVPYMAAALSGFAFAPLSDYLIKRNILTRIHARRTFQLFGAYGLTVCMLLLAYVAKTQVLAVTLLALGNVCYASTLVGWSVNHIDLSPKFAGILSGISITTSQGIAMLSPLIVHFIVKDLSDANQWKLVFIIASLFYFVCATIFGIFSSATRQKWDDADPSETALDVDARAT